MWISAWNSIRVKANLFKNLFKKKFFFSFERIFIDVFCPIAQFNRNNSKFCVQNKKKIICHHILWLESHLLSFRYLSKHPKIFQDILHSLDKDLPHSWQTWKQKYWYSICASVVIKLKVINHIKLHQSMLTWVWYDDSSSSYLILYLSPRRTEKAPEILKLNRNLCLFILKKCAR